MKRLHHQEFFDAKELRSSATNPEVSGLRPGMLKKILFYLNLHIYVNFTLLLTNEQLTLLKINSSFLYLKFNLKIGVEEAICMWAFAILYPKLRKHKPIFFKF